MMQKTSGVNLSERFLGSVVGEMFQLPSDLLLHVGALAQRNLPAGSFVQIFQVQPPACGGLAREDLPVFHVSESMASKAWSSLVSSRSMMPGSMTSLAEMEKTRASKVSVFVLKPRAL